MAELMRAAALTGYFQTMKELGFDPAPLLREEGLSRALLSNPEQMISAGAISHLLERSAEITRCRTLGLRMAQMRGLADVGVTSVLIQHEATLRMALETLTRHSDRINPFLTVNLEDFGESTLLRLNFRANEAASAQQATDLALSALARLCSIIVGEAWQPEMVCFTCEAPPASELPTYFRIFRCRAEFNAECDGIVVPSRDLDLPCQRADQGLATHARNLINATMSAELPNMSHQVEKSLLLLLPSGHATIQSCSALLGISVRTLQRSLDTEGTNFSSLLHNARVQLANQLLSNPRTQITNVAGLLGYRSVSAFTRWHKQTCGMSPTERRKRV